MQRLSEVLRPLGGIIDATYLWRISYLPIVFFLRTEYQYTNPIKHIHELGTMYVDTTALTDRCAFPPCEISKKANAKQRILYFKVLINAAQQVLPFATTLYACMGRKVVSFGLVLRCSQTAFMQTPAFLSTYHFSLIRNAGGVFPPLLSRKKKKSFSAGTHKATGICNIQPQNTLTSCQLIYVYRLHFSFVYVDRNIANIPMV